jgi:hemin uptake protein HemP
MCRGISGQRVVDSDELLQGQRELFIIHSGQVYRLLRTRNDKLILQK